MRQDLQITVIWYWLLILWRCALCELLLLPQLARLLLSSRLLPEVLLVLVLLLLVLLLLMTSQQ